MPARDFLFLVAICLLWSVNLVVTRWVVSELQVPPLFLAGMRTALLCLVLIPFLRPVPRQIGTVFLISMGVGALHFGLVYVGLAKSTASAAALVWQAEIPIRTLLSIIFLGERIGLRRALGIVLSVSGVCIIVFNPEDLSPSLGLVLVAVAAVAWAAASILMKKIEPMKTMQLQGWVATFSTVPLLAASALLEEGQISAALAGGWQLAGALFYAVLAVSIIGYGGYYVLIKRHEMTLIAPLTLMNPLFTVVLGVALLGEPLTWKLAAGGLACMLGIGLITLRSDRAPVTVPRPPSS